MCLRTLLTMEPACYLTAVAKLFSHYIDFLPEEEKNSRTAGASRRLTAFDKMWAESGNAIMSIDNVSLCCFRHVRLSLLRYNNYFSSFKS